MSQTLLSNAGRPTSQADVATRADSRGLLGERPLNWLALGLLLAAWNAADDDARTLAKPKPLRAHAFVSVRALARANVLPR